MINFSCTRSLSDDTYVYNVYLDKEYTVEEFINIILNGRGKKEWGKFHLGNMFSSLGCSYKNGVLTSQLSKQHMNLKIKKVTANGGWGSMDYAIEV